MRYAPKERMRIHTIGRERVPWLRARVLGWHAAQEREARTVPLAVGIR